jgi:hypothetical protein
MTILKSVMVATVLMAGSPLAIAQNSPATGGEHPVAGGAAGGDWGWYRGGCYDGTPTATATTRAYMATIDPTGPAIPRLAEW